MSKKTRVSPAKNCKCDKCGALAHAIPGASHRRCPGGEGSLRDKANKLPTAQRGRWN